jgi:hypothetical protein
MVIDMTVKQKDVKRFNWITPISMLWAFLLVSCLGLKTSNTKSSSDFPNSPDVDRSFTTGEPCEAPCWYNLKLGVSTTSDVRSTLAKLPFVDQATFYEYAYDTNELVFGFDCTYYHVPGGGGCGVLETSQDGKLKRIFISVQYNLTLQEVIKKLGVPKFYTTTPSINKDICLVEIYWPESNIEVSIEDSPRKRLCKNSKNEKIDLDVQIKSLIYAKISV